MVMNNTHQVTKELRQRVSDLAESGIPKYLIAQIIGIDDDTLSKHYAYQLATAKAECVARIGKTVIMQARDGCAKSQALYLKTQGAQHGWVEKQIVENVSNEETNELRAKVAELESKFERDY